MLNDDFPKRLAQIRQCFGDTLTGKVNDSFDCLPKISNENPGAIETIIVTHRNLHSMCGIAPSLGFPATGKAARAAEKALSVAATTRRVLTPKELETFVATLKQLRAAADSELQSVRGGMQLIDFAAG